MSRTPSSFRDLPDIDRAHLSKWWIACDHQEPALLRQHGEDVLTDGIADYSGSPLMLWTRRPRSLGLQPRAPARIRLRRLWPPRPSQNVTEKRKLVKPSWSAVALPHPCPRSFRAAAMRLFRAEFETMRSPPNLTDQVTFLTTRMRCRKNCRAQERIASP